MWTNKPDWGAVPLLPPPPPHSWIGWHLYFSWISGHIFVKTLSNVEFCFCFLNHIRNLWGAFLVIAKTTCRPRRGDCTSSWWRLPCTPGTTQAGAPKDNHEEDDDNANGHEICHGDNRIWNDPSNFDHLQNIDHVWIDSWPLLPAGAVGVQGIQPDLLLCEKPLPPLRPLLLHLLEVVHVPHHQPLLHLAHIYNQSCGTSKTSSILGNHVSFPDPSLECDPCRDETSVGVDLEELLTAGQAVRYQAVLVSVRVVEVCG